MSIWNKVLLFLLFLVALVFFHAAARTLRTYVYWSNLAAICEKKLNERRAEIAGLQTADREHPLPDTTIGVQQLRIDLGRILANRGRIWTKCEKQKAVFDPNKPGILEVAISIDEAAPFTDKMMVYAFEEGDDQSPGKYLGEFRVEKVGERQIQLASTTPMPKSVDPKKVKFPADNVMESKTPWVLYELMPTDEHEAFANLPEDQKKWLESDAKKWDSNEYMKDGQTDANGKKFERPLRDYLAIFRGCDMYRTLYQDRVNATENDLKYLTAAKQAVIEQEAVVEKERSEVTLENKRAHAELSAVSEDYAALQRMLSFNQTAVKEAIARNLASTKEIAALQKKAVELIDRRTRSMAQIGPGAN